MSELKGFQGQAGIVGFCRSIYAASIFVLYIGLARSMGTDAFGSFQQVFIFNAVFLILTLGIPETMYYFLPRLSGEERPRFLGQTLLILCVTGGFSLLLFWFAAPFFAKIQHNASIVPQLRIFGIYGAFLVASSFSDPVFITFKRFRYLFTLNALHALFLVGLTAWYITEKGTPHTLFSAMAVFGFCKFILAITLLYRMRPVMGEIWLFRGKSMLLLQLSFSLPIVLSSATDIISRWLDKYMVSFFFGTEALGVFFVGAIEIPFIGILVSSVYSVVSPVLNSLNHKNDTAGFVKLTGKTIKFISKIIWPVFVYFFVFADHIIPLVFKDAFQGAVIPFRIYLLMMPLRIASFGVIMLALGRPRIVFKCAFLALSANFVLNIVLALKIGFIGPAIATVVSTYMHVFMLLFIIIRELKVRVRELIPMSFLFSVAITSGLAVTLAYGLTRHFPGDLRTIISSFFLFSGVYLFLGSKAGLIQLADFLELAGGRYFGKRTKGRKS